VGQKIMVDQVRPLFDKNPGDCRFSAGNAACQARIQHFFYASPCLQMRTGSYHISPIILNENHD
jgi:hypothetical protein